MQKIFLSLTCALLMTSCLAPEEAQVEHRPLNLVFNQFLEKEGNLDNKPNTFVVFYWPTELTWQSPLYAEELPFEVKLERVISEVNRLSLVVDALDTDIFDYMQTPEYPALEAKFKECMADRRSHADCDSFVGAWLPQKKTEAKAAAFDEIRSNLDGPELMDPVNFVPVGDPTDSLFRLSGSRASIQLKKFGKLGQDASTKNGDIVDWLTKVNSMGRTLMSFTVKERGADGAYNGRTHHFELERRSFLNYARYQGRVTLKEGGVPIRFGVAKIDFQYL